ncbi:MAG: hypothetical protein QME81_00190 [bacterium]|nr:hypothetical protein [bacterium]
MADIADRIDRLKEETWEILERIARRQEETDERIARRQEKIDEELDKLARSQEKTDEELRVLNKATNEELSKLSKDVSRLIKSEEILCKQLGRHINSWGLFVEGMVAPSIPEIFKPLGVDVVALYQRALRRKNGDEMEIDVLCPGKREDGREIVIVTEVKSTFEVNDVNYFIERLKEFREFFDEFRDKDVIGVAAGVTFRPEARKYAQRKGFYVLVPSGEVMKLWNRPDFKPKVWNGPESDEINQEG